MPLPWRSRLSDVVPSAVRRDLDAAFSSGTSELERAAAAAESPYSAGFARLTLGLAT